MAVTAGALIENPELWNSLDWSQIQADVRRLQMRIAKAVEQQHWGKVKSLQRRLTRSLSAKLWAVKRVTSNKGKRTPGVDGIVWHNNRQKVEAAFGLKQRGYRALALRRIYISKKKGKKKRPLSIPTMRDRAMQFLFKLALAPVAESTADRNSYGFREGRCCHDAIQAAFNALSKPNSAPWVLEGDIKGCFDNFNHQWMLDHIPMDKGILSKWLQAGYIEKGRLYPSRKGTPQGGIISPTLSNMALDGLENVVLESAPRRSRINFVRYADDFIITAKSRTILEQHVKPAIEAFLSKRGLELSPEKTVITHITQGFTFLGQTFRKQGGKLHITPSNDAVKSITQKLGALMRKYVASPAPALIKALNQTLRGWGNYHKHVVSSETFSRIDTYVFEQLWRILRKRHPKKSKHWLIKRYWTASGRTSRFSVKHKTVDRCVKVYSVIRLCDLPRSRFVKIKADANPYQKEYAKYFYERRHNSAMKVLGALSAKEYRKKKLHKQKS